MSYSDFIFYSHPVFVSFDCMMIIYARCSWDLVWHFAWGLRLCGMHIVEAQSGHIFFFVSTTVCRFPVWSFRSILGVCFVAVTRHGFFVVSSRIFWSYSGSFALIGLESCMKLVYIIWFYYILTRNYFFCIYLCILLVVCDWHFAWGLRLCGMHIVEARFGHRVTCCATFCMRLTIV